MWVGPYAALGLVVRRAPSIFQATRSLVSASRRIVLAMGRAAIAVRETSADIAVRFAVIGMAGALAYVLVHLTYSALAWLRSNSGA